MTLKDGHYGLRPRGRSGLKLFSGDDDGDSIIGLRPRGRSGLKFVIHSYTEQCKKSPSSRAEWVEIMELLGRLLKHPSLRPRGRSGLKLLHRQKMSRNRSVSVLAGGVG